MKKQSSVVLVALMTGAIQVWSYTQPIENGSIVNVQGDIWSIPTTLLYVGLATPSNQLYISNGGVVESGAGTIGYSYYGTGDDNKVTVYGSGSMWTMPNGRLHVGEYGDKNKLCILNGGLVQSKIGYVGQYAAAKGNVAEIVGIGSVWTNSAELYIGYDSENSSMQILDGGNVFSTIGIIGLGSSSSSANVLVDGTGSVWKCSQMLRVGMDGNDHRLFVKSGGRVESSWADIGSFGDNNSILIDGSGSQWLLSGALKLGSSGVDHGTGNSLLISNDGFVSATSVTIFSGNTITLESGGTLSVSGNFDANQDGTIINSGGTLQVGGDLSGLSLVPQGMRLGAKKVIGNLTVEGTLAPGASPGFTTVDGQVFFTASSTLEMELEGYVAGSGYDQLTVTNTAVLDGVLEVKLLNGFMPTNGAVFNLFNWSGGVVGAFAEINLPTVSDTYWITNQIYTTGELSVIVPPNSDDDGDGILDNWEWRHYGGTNFGSGYNADADDLTSLEEFQNGTDPNNPDTDSDGFDDAFEVTQGMSPTNDNSSIISYISGDTATFGLYTSNQLGVLAVGDLMIRTSNDQVNVHLQLQRSDDLNTFTNAGPTVEWFIPAGAKEFYKVRAEP